MRGELSRRVGRRIFKSFLSVNFLNDRISVVRAILVCWIPLRNYLNKEISSECRSLFSMNFLHEILAMRHHEQYHDETISCKESNLWTVRAKNICKHERPRRKARCVNSSTF